MLVQSGATSKWEDGMAMKEWAIQVIYINFMFRTLLFFLCIFLFALFITYFSENGVCVYSKSAC